MQNLNPSNGFYIIHITKVFLCSKIESILKGRVGNDSTFFVPCST